MCLVYFFFYQLQLRQEEVEDSFIPLSVDKGRLCLCSHGDKIQGAFWLLSCLLPTPAPKCKWGREERERGAFVSQVFQLLLLIKQRALVHPLPCLRRVGLGLKTVKRQCWSVGRAGPGEVGGLLGPISPCAAVLLCDLWLALGLCFPGCAGEVIV